MNKTEKLLAARKKLKEFQLHKSNHDQEVNNTTNQSNNHDQVKVEFHQNDNNVQSENHKTNYNDDTANIEIKNEQLQPYLDTKLISNNVEIEENPKSIGSLIYSNEEDAEIAIKNSEISRKIAESFEIDNTEDIKSQFNFPHLQQEWLPHKMQMKLFETMNVTKSNNNIINDSKSFEIGTIGNEVNSLNSQFVMQNSPNTITPTIDSIFIDKTNDDDKSTSYIELENENKSLLLSLEDEKNKIKHLEIQINQSHDKIAKLESLFEQKNAECNNEYSQQINSLTETIQMHCRAAEILVAEKADLTAALSQYQTVAQHKSDEVSELYGKLKYTVGRMTELEKDFNNVKVEADNDRIMKDKLTNDYTQLEQQYIELKKVREEQQLETAELRQDLNIKNSELINLQQKMEENKNLLSLAELKLQQLTSAPQQLEEIENQHEAHLTLKQQLAQLQENLKTINNEKDEMCKHYESYVKQLNTKYEGTVRELEIAQKKIHEFGEREESLIQRLSLMEQHYQREKQKVDSLLPLQGHEEKIIHLTKSMDSLVLEHENLQRTLHEKEAEIETMKVELQELRELRDQSVETSKLVTALESEQLGASRAVSQNQQLKLQLHEMHDAFVMLSNTKLNLTEQLQDERTVGRKLNAECSRIEAERDELKEELNRKAAIIDELEKDKLHYVQMVDQMQHYQVQSTQARTLQQELQNALSTVEILKNENRLLNEKIHGSIETVDKINTEHEHENLEDVNGECIDEKNITTETVIEQQKIVNDVQELQKNSHDSIDDNQKKLESRFKETMERVAELTDEKQRLEHLVLQLQGETETIGEYITLYQKQRAILQMKAQEKERTFNQLLEERNQQQGQLHQLKILIAELLKVDGVKNTPNSSINHHHNVLPETSRHDENPADQHNVTENRTENTNSVNLTKVENNNTNETTSKILEILTEIKDCKDMCSGGPNIHHCLWCSGKLITV